MSAARQDRLLRLSDWLRQHLEQADSEVALVARAGLDLRPYGLRLSHAGIALRQGLDSPWAVRQLYYACDEARPRLFDQGLAGFVAGTPAERTAHVELLLLPPGAPAQALRETAGDHSSALGLLGEVYTANAYAWGTRYQNCNQWLAELLGHAWQGQAEERRAALGPPKQQDASQAPAREHTETAARPPFRGQAPAWGHRGGAGDAAPWSGPPTRAVEQRRALAQTWLKSRGYQPHVFQLGPVRTWLAGFWPLVSLEDHPAEDLAAHRLRVSMPESILTFVSHQVPTSQRWRVCLTAERAVLRVAGPDLDDSCDPVALHGDRVLSLLPG